MDTWKQMMDWKRMAEQYFGDQFFSPANPKNTGVNGGAPLCNVYETAQEICCLFALPGLGRTEDVEIFVDSAKLTIQGRLSLVMDPYKLNKEEFQLGEFKREIQLPSSVQQDPVQAFYRKGLLYIRMLKDQKTGERKRRVPINWVQD
jgi:HSP20 family protein